MAIKVSIVVVSRGKKELLSRAVDSLINQNYGANNFEIIIIDDGSKTDDLQSLINEKKKKFVNIKCISQKPSGLAAGRNFGAENAQGSIVAFTDNDCIADPKWLENIVEKFKDPDLVGVEGKIIPSFPDEPVKPRKIFTNAPENLSGGKFTGANSAYRKDIIEKAGYYDEQMNFWREDSEFAFRAKEFGKIEFAQNAIIYHPLREYLPLNVFNYLFYLKNEIICLGRHPAKYFQYWLWWPIVYDILKSAVVVYLTFRALGLFLNLNTIIFILFTLPLVFLILILTFNLPRFVGLLVFRGPDFHLSDSINVILYGILSWIKYIFYPFFLVYGIVIALPLITAWPKKVKK